MSDLKPCPFCGGHPTFRGGGKNWQDDNRYVLMELECCVSMRASVGWAKARDMTPAAIEATLKTKLTESWNTRHEPEPEPMPITSESGNQAAQGASAITSESVPLLSDAELCAIGVTHGRATTVDGYECNTLWFDGDLRPDYRAIESLVRAKLREKGIK